MREGYLTHRAVLHSRKHGIHLPGQSDSEDKRKYLPPTHQCQPPNIHSATTHNPEHQSTNTHSHRWLETCIYWRIKSELNFEVLYHNCWASCLNLTGNIANTSDILMLKIEGRLKLFYKYCTDIQSIFWVLGCAQILLQNYTHKTVRSWKNTTYNMIIKINTK